MNRSVNSRAFMLCAAIVFLCVLLLCAAASIHTPPRTDGVTHLRSAQRAVSLHAYAPLTKDDSHIDQLRDEDAPSAGGLSAVLILTALIDLLYRIRRLQSRRATCAFRNVNEPLSKLILSLSLGGNAPPIAQP